MKLYLCFETGYTRGVKGCTGEYFNLVIINTKKEIDYKTYKFKGLYGVESRVGAVLKDKGYKFIPTWTNYGKLKRDDITKDTLDESSIINLLKKEL